jgi:putative nucleotidyltransferase with HDIG domain
MVHQNHEEKKNSSEFFDCMSRRASGSVEDLRVGRRTPFFSCLTSLREVRQNENLIGAKGYRTIMDRSSAIALLRQYVQGDALVKHCLATGAVMKACAKFFSEDPVRWEEIGILHDIDFEVIKGDMQQHGTAGARILKNAGIADDICEVIQRHNHHLHAGSYDRPVEIALQAADSVSGLIIACALVKGGRLSDVSAKTITKKAKEKSFAAGCDRNRIALIAPLMDVSVFYQYALMGLTEIRTELGLA